MASIWKHRKSINLFAQFVAEDGRRVNRSTGTPDRRKARIIADGWEHSAKLARQGTLTPDRTRAVLSEILERASDGLDSLRAIPANEFFANWLDHKLATKSAATADRYRATVKQFLAHLGARAVKPLAAIRPTDVQAFLTARGKVRSSKTVDVDAKSLSAAFAYARRQGLIDRNPVDAVELPKVESQERAAFTPAQVGLLVATATGDWKTAIRTAYYTGARLSDVVNLDWNSFNLVDGTLTYRQRKTGETVMAPLHPDLLAYLEGIAGDTAGPVMPSLAGRTTGGTSGLSAEFNDLMRAAGIAQDRTTQKSGRTFAALSFHSLRHTWESLLAAGDVSPELRRELVGRADAATQKTYTHHEMDNLRRGLAKLPSIATK